MSNENASKDADFGKNQRRIYAFMCLFGSVFSYYSRKLIYDQDSYNFQGCIMTKFSRPWFVTLSMSIGMAMASLLYLLILIFKKEPPVSFKMIPFRSYISAIFPAVCDLAFSVLYNITTLMISSIFTVTFNFFMLLFTALFRRFLLKQRTLPYAWFSIGILIVGIILSSISVAGDEIQKTKLSLKLLFGCGVQLIAQVLAALKAISEEKILHQNDLSPIWLCGIEGIYEALLLLFAFFPLLYISPKSFGEQFQENFCSDFLMVIHSPKLMLNIFVYLFIAMCYNTGLMGVILTTSAIGFSVVESIASTVMWMMDLFIHYQLHGFLFNLNSSKFGEPWVSASYIRLAGYLLVIIGALIYIKIVKLSCFQYEESNIKVINMDDIN